MSFSVGGKSPAARASSGSRFNEPTRGMVPKGRPTMPKTAFGGKAPSAKGS